MEKAIYTIGYGNRKIEDFFGLLKSYKIQFIIDVRSSPYSKISPSYNIAPLSALSVKNGIRYAFWGDSLGGKPKFEELYSDNGKVDYAKIQEQDDFKISIERLMKAYNQGFKVALMCSELRPEECHRSKLIGEYLNDKEIAVSHIDEAGFLKSHSNVMLKVTKGVNTKDLFGDSFLSSRGTYGEVNKVDFEFFTIGAYNSIETSFFKKLVDNSIDTFVDIRQRRGVRGAEYSFVNSNKLQQRLSDLGINYLYMADLAPTSEIREIQKEADLKSGIQKRDRDFLGNLFIKEYTQNILDHFDFDSFFDLLRKSHSKKIVFFCVEEKHTACHRSILSKKLFDKFNYYSKNL